MKGFLTFAQNTSRIDYLQLAYLQALNVKVTQPNAKYAVIVDATTNERVTNKHRAVFDHVILLDEDYNQPDSSWKLANECQAFRLSPFKETLKIESDILFTTSIEHWWTAFRFKDIVLSTGCREYTGNLSQVRKYRQIFDDNHLPDTYSGLMYFRYSKTAYDFFALASDIRANWDEIRDGVLKNCREDTPSTDVLFSVTAATLGTEHCTLPSLDFINFVHMKPGLYGWDDNRSWYDTVLYEQDEDIIRINNLNQYHPVHYQDKNFATEELIEYYEHRYSQR